MRAESQFTCTVQDWCTIQCQKSSKVCFLHLPVSRNCQSDFLLLFQRNYLHSFCSPAPTNFWTAAKSIQVPFFAPLYFAECSFMKLLTCKNLGYHSIHSAAIYILQNLPFWRLVKVCETEIPLVAHLSRHRFHTIVCLQLLIGSVYSNLTFMELMKLVHGHDRYSYNT